MAAIVLLGSIYLLSLWAIPLHAQLFQMTFYPEFSAVLKLLCEPLIGHKIITSVYYLKAMRWFYVLLVKKKANILPSTSFSSIKLICSWTSKLFILCLKFLYTFSSEHNSKYIPVSAAGGGTWKNFTSRGHLAVARNNFGCHK